MNFGKMQCRCQYTWGILPDAGRRDGPDPTKPPQKTPQILDCLRMDGSGDRLLVYCMTLALSPSVGPKINQVRESADRQAVCRYVKTYKVA